MDKNKIIVFDTTLRDGEQTPYVAFNTKEKLKIAKLLYEAGADELEVGIPAMGKKEQDDLKEILALNLPIQIMSWNRATMGDLEASLKCGLKAVDLSIPVSDILIDIKFGGNKTKLLKQLEEEHCLPHHYFILEVSANLRHRQLECIQQQIPHLAHKVIWLDSWPENSFNGIILANEVLDAMPVHRFMLTEQGVMENFITLNDKGELQETYLPCNNEALLEHIQSLQLKTRPYLSEANLFLNDWIARNYQVLNQGVMLLIDYGFPRHEYYHPDRNQGTLMCHYKHQAHTNPLLHLGEQDITAHVDFTHVAEAAVKAGFHVAGFTNQASFLLANDLLSLLTSLHTEKELLQAKQAIKQLTHPNEMGELFKVIALSKEVPLALNGFQLQDKRASL